MGKILDFKTKYAQKIFSVDPSFSSLGGLGWSIINLDAQAFGGSINKPFLHRCGLIKPFSTDSNLVSMKDLCVKLQEIWRNDSGYSEEPMVLVVELPVIYPNVNISLRSIRDLILFSGMIAQILQPYMLLTPTPADWKSNQPKGATEKLILDSLDLSSKKILERDFSSIALDQRHNVFDAIGLGLYAREIYTEKKSPPRMAYKLKG